MTEKLAIGVAPSGPLHRQLICRAAASLSAQTLVHAVAAGRVLHVGEAQVHGTTLLVSSVPLCCRYYYLNNV